MELVEVLRKEERALLTRLATVRATLEIYGEQQAETTSAPAPLIPLGAPSLDGLRTRDAISIYLRWAQDNGRDRITLGELEKVLLANRVVSFRGVPLTNSRSPWKLMCNIFGAPGNQDQWVIEKHSEAQYQRADLIGLKQSSRK